MADTNSVSRSRISLARSSGAILWGELSIDSVPVDVSQNRDRCLASMFGDEFTQIPCRFPHVNILVSTILVAGSESDSLCRE